MPSNTDFIVPPLASGGFFGEGVVTAEVSLSLVSATLLMADLGLCLPEMEVNANWTGAQRLFLLCDWWIRPPCGCGACKGPAPHSPQGSRANTGLSLFLSQQAVQWLTCSCASRSAEHWHWVAQGAPLDY